MHLDPMETLNQVGRGNLMAISGGRYMVTGEDRIELPVRYGYSVEIVLLPSDTYRVSRLFRRGAKTFDKGFVEDIYCDQLGDVAYSASCYHHDFPGSGFSWS